VLPIAEKKRRSSNAWGGKKTLQANPVGGVMKGLFSLFGKGKALCYTHQRQKRKGVPLSRIGTRGEQKRGVQFPKKVGKSDKTKHGSQGRKSFPDKGDQRTLS